MFICPCTPYHTHSHTHVQIQHVYPTQTHSHVYTTAHINTQAPVYTTHSSVSVHTSTFKCTPHTFITRACWAHTGISKLRISDSSQLCLVHSPLRMTSCCCTSGTYCSLRTVLDPSTPQRLRVAEGPSAPAAVSVML